MIIYRNKPSFANFHFWEPTLRGDAQSDNNEPTALRARFELAVALPAGRVERRTVADDTLKRLLSQDTGLLNPAYLKFELGPDEWMLPVYCRLSL